MLITLADQPMVGAAALRLLISRFDEQRRIIASEYSGTLGVPIVIGTEYIPALSRLDGDKGAACWLSRAGELVTAVPMPEAATDIDTEADASGLARHSR